MDAHARARMPPPHHTPKLAARSARPLVPKTPAHLKSPPLTTSNNLNTPHHPHESSLSSVLSPKEGGGSVKIKVKSAITPESKSRLLIKPMGARAQTPSVPPLPNHTPSIKLVNRRPFTPDQMKLADEGWMSAEPGEEGFVAGLDDYEEDTAETEAVLVSVRVRPPNPVELNSDAGCVWTMPEHDQHIIKLAKGTEGMREDRDWIFDRILPPHSDNGRTYGTSARRHVRSAMEGYNAVIFAYGQTASGKTHTLTGSAMEPGIIPLSISDLFAQIRSTPDREFLLRASYLELYNETIFDLLSPVPGAELHLSESKKGVVINGLTEVAVRTEQEVRKLLRSGEDRRKVGATDWNARSSRSHCVFRVTIESRARSGGGEETPNGARTPGGRLKAAGDKMTRISTLSIIDLAGSEKHTSSKERNAEGKHINQSLLTLKLVISKLADLASKRNVTHVPYRDSKLTRLLQNSLSGDALISVICTVSPSSLNLAESISTLAFAQGLKRVVLKAQKKEVVDPQALIQQYQNEIAELRAQLREKEATGGSKAGSSKNDRANNEAMEKRLNELKSMILTSVSVNSPNPDDQAAMIAPSPAKMKYPKLEYDRPSAELLEELHAEQLHRAELEDEVARLKAELAMRPLEPNKQIVVLQNEVSELRLIADDYERHLLEPSRKVRADVEKEFSEKFKTLENQLDSKKIWANRLDENVRFLTQENKALTSRYEEAEAKVSQIIEFINLALSPPSDDPSSPIRSNQDTSPSGQAPLSAIPPTLVVSDDFSPSPTNQGGRSTLTLSASKMRATFSQMDLANFNDKFGTLTVSGKGRGGGGGGAGGWGMGKMLREESSFGLAEVAGCEDEDEGF
ncbi:centromeric protein E [Kwoniella heveanensis CBS 569]|nr:centromeric protein E [Kwoniella heveanensis CBS 569]